MELDINNDVEKIREQKKSSIIKEINWIGKAIKLVQNNENFLNNNATMYK